MKRESGREDIPALGLSLEQMLLTANHGPPKCDTCASAQLGWAVRQVGVHRMILSTFVLFLRETRVKAYEDRGRGVIHLKSYFD